MKIIIGIADDQQLFMKSLATLINGFENCAVVIEALHGKELLSMLSNIQPVPDILLIDVNMPVMDGAEVAKIIAKDYPLIKMIALSMKDDDLSIIKMLKAGCCAYLLKDIHPAELEKALEGVHSKGYYNADLINLNYRRIIVKGNEIDSLKLSNREKEFLHYATSELTYREIADKMFLSERTIDGYRESLFEKLNVRSRVGMVLEALRKELVTL